MTLLAELDRVAIANAARKYGVMELSVFGSAVTNEYNESSDLDFLVDFLPNRNDAFDDYVSLRDELIAITRREVDLIVKRAIRNPYFRDEALAQAEQLYVAEI